MSPDWSAKIEPVPYSKLGDPQTLNLYGYVGNNPMSRTDADVHDWCDACNKFFTALRNTLQIKTSIGSGAQVSGSMLGMKITAGASTKTVTTFTPLGTKPSEEHSQIESGVQAQVGSKVFSKFSNTMTIGPNQDEGSLSAKGGAASMSLSPSGSTTSTSASNSSVSTSGSVSLIGLTVGAGPVLAGVELSVSTSDLSTALSTAKPALYNALDTITGGIFDSQPSQASGQAPSIWNLPQQ